MRLGIRKSSNMRIFLFAIILSTFIFLLVPILKRLEAAYNLHFLSLANNVANEVTSTAVYDIFNDNDFSSFMELKNTAENKITAINSDTAKINRLKSEIILNINNKIREHSPEKVYIPLMSASGIGILSGAGVKIPIKISPMSLVNSEFREKFTGAGINCVKYTLSLDVTIDIRGSGFLYSISEPVKTEVIIIDTIISGDIPNYYGTEVGLVGEE